MIRKYVKYFMVFIESACCILLLTLQGNSETMKQQEKMVIDFNNTDEIENWRIVNDGVMGGLSKSEIVLSDENTAIFQGTVSLEHYGGFASTRAISHDYKLHGYTGLLVRIKGDGRRYQLRIRTDDRFDGVSYRTHVDTNADS